MDEIGWNNVSLSIGSGVNTATLSRFFNGKQELDVAQLTRIAESMQRHPGDFLPRSTVDPMCERLKPIIEHLTPLQIEDQMRAISALEVSLVAMKNWKSQGSILGSPITTSVKPEIKANRKERSGDAPTKL